MLKSEKAKETFGLFPSSNNSEKSGEGEILLSALISYFAGSA